MPEEKQTQNEKKNSVAAVGMRFSIIWLVILVLNMIGIATIFNETTMSLWLVLFVFTLVLWIWIPLFFIWFILWIIWLFYSPKIKALIAVLIPIFSMFFINASVNAPTNEFALWAQDWAQQTDRDNLDEDKLEDVFEAESNKIITSKTKDERISMYNSYNGFNPIKKISYLFFSVVKECMEVSLDKFNNWEMPAINNDEDKIITVEIENNENPNEENNNSEIESESVEVFTQSEKNDIEEIINILE